jgi:1-acyl-sn-glycerol-3-phosphate acyltransferase
MMILLRSLAFNIVMFASGAVLSLYGRLILRAPPARLIKLGQLWAKICLAALKTLCRIDIELEGREFRPTSGPALIAAQHQSAFDTIVWLRLLPFTAYVLKHELLRLPLLGPLLVPSGFIAVDRDAGAASLRKLLADCRQAAAAGRQIVIFPEGTRVAPGARATIHPGVIAIARALDLPIIPVATNSGLFWGRGAFFKYPGHLRIRIYPPLPRDLSREAIMAHLRHSFYEAGVDNSVDQPARQLATDINKKS